MSHPREPVRSRRPGRDCRPHPRRTFASQLGMRGVALQAVQEFLRHATLDMPRRYAHLAPDDNKDAVRLLALPATHAVSPTGARETAEDTGGRGRPIDNPWRTRGSLERECES